MKALSVCGRLMRNVTQRLKNIMVFGCISLYAKGCCLLKKVSMPRLALKGVMFPLTENQATSTSGPPLPDDVLEMILLRLPLRSLMVARCVCRTWRYMMSTTSFIQTWYQASCHTPWLFLVGDEIQAFDVSLSQLHQSSHDLLKKRDGFSVVSVGYEVYIIGGRFLDRYQWKSPPQEVIYNGVLMFNPLTGSWCEAAPMKSPRVKPAVGHLEIPMVSDYVRCALNCDANENVEKRANHVKSIIIVAGGLGPQNQPLDTCELYDSKSNRWVDIARLPGDLGAVCSGVVCGGVFFVYSDAHKLASYILEKDYWVTIQISQPAFGDYSKLLCCSGRLFLSCDVYTQHGPGGMVEIHTKRLWEIVLPLSTTKEAILLSKWSARDSKVSFTSERDKIYSFQLSDTTGMELHSIDCLDGILTWECLTEKTVTDVRYSSLFPRKICVLHL